MRILIVKIAAIGDVVMSLPLLTSLRHKYPEAVITWICGKGIAPLIEATKMVDKIITVDEKKLLKGSFLIKAASLCSIWCKIFGKRYDLSFRLHADYRYKAIDWPIVCKNKKSWGDKKNRSHPISGRYHAIESLALNQVDEGPWIEDFQYPDLKLPSVKFKADIIIAPGGAKNVLADDHQRRWPIKHYAELIHLLNQHSLTIAIIGSKDDEWIVPHLKGCVFENWLGKFNLLETISCLKNSRLFITHDTGPLHLAKLAGCQSIALFGPTNPFEKVSSKENIKVFWGGEKLSCRPCYNGKTYAPCKDNLCLSTIPPKTIYEDALQKI